MESIAKSRIAELKFVGVTRYYKDVLSKFRKEEAFRNEISYEKVFEENEGESVELSCLVYGLLDSLLSIVPLMAGECERIRQNCFINKNQNTIEVSQIRLYAGHILGVTKELDSTGYDSEGLGTVSLMLFEIAEELEQTLTEEKGE